MSVPLANLASPEKRFSIIDEDGDDAYCADNNLKDNYAELPRHESGTESIERLAELNSYPKSNFSIFSCWNILTFQWMRPLLELGSYRALEPADLYDLFENDQAEKIHDQFLRCWNQELRRCQDQSKSKKPSLSWTMARAYGFPFMCAGFLKFVTDCCQLVGPLILNQLIRFLSDPTIPANRGYYYVAALFLANVAMSLCLRQYFWWCYRVGLRLRSCVITSVYHKTLVMSTASLSRKTTGEIINLMSVDSTRLQELTPYLHAIWYSFFQIAVAITLLWQQLGLASLAGLFVIVFFIPVTARISNYMKTIQKQISGIRDERIKITNEILAGMKVIKIQAWEREYKAKIEEIRDNELKVFRKYSMLQACSGTLFLSISVLVGIASLSAYIALGNTLDVATALTSLALFEMLRFPLFMLPNVINSIVEARVSVDRVQGYLLHTERKPIIPGPLTHSSVLVERASIIWEKQFGKKLKDLPKQSYSTLAYNFCMPIFTVSYWCSATMALYTWFKSLYMSRSIDQSYGSHERLATTENDVDSGNDNDSTINSPIHNDNGTVQTFSQSSSPDRSDCEFNPNISLDAEKMTESEYSSTLQKIILYESDNYIQELESKLMHTEFTLQTLKQARQNSESSQTSMKDEYRGTVREDPSFATDALSAHMKYDYQASTTIEQDSLKGVSKRSKRKITIPTESQQSIKSTIDEKGPADRWITLFRANLQLECGQLIALVGQVASGKSSLLCAILGEMKIVYGKVYRKGSVAYVGQKPFIQNSTLRENITFGLPLDEVKYHDVLNRCALTPDLKVLPAGDMTEIGERGINLSGGQKSRVALARAMYSDAELYLLDDPLAAVDVHVGKHLFHECILQLLQSNKGIILVTNAMHYSKYFTQIVVLKHGRVAELGTFEELLQIESGLFVDMYKASMETRTESKSIDELENISYTNLSGHSSQNISTKSYKENNENLKFFEKDALSLKVNSNIAQSTTQKLAIDSVPVSPNKFTLPMSPTIVQKPSVSTGQLITTEERESGDVSLEIYRRWAKASGGMIAFIGVTLLYMFGEISSVVSSWWISYWSENRYNGTPWFYLGIFVCFNVVTTILTLTKEVCGRLVSIRASKILFDEVLHAVLYAPMSFFDTTPIGRVINRFSKDIYTVDEQLPGTVRGYLSTMIKVLGTVMYIVLVSPFFLIGLIPVAMLYMMSQRYYIKTSRELSRLDSTSRSPIYALFGETLDGLTTIRAFGREEKFASRNNSLLDTNQKAYFLSFSANCWLAVRLEFAGTMIVTMTALLAVIARDYKGIGSTGIADDKSYAMYAGMAGLAISLSLSVTQSLNWTVRMASDLESAMVSVERITRYSTMEQEAAYTLPTDPHPSWPTEGGIRLVDLCMRYRPGLPLVLKGVSLQVKPKEKIGIVGRTGAGKSSLLSVLLRLVEAESGAVYIDGKDISQIGLHCLRSRIAVIPQDPVLFSGTIRSNLDPFKLYADVTLWESLQRTELTESISSLDDRVTENGANYSVGQRQLLCIARALLQKSKIIIMDEATAAVDVETDASIQKTIREECRDATCLTVAHRLNTIMTSDKVLVMDDGRVAEFDTPENLLSTGFNSNGSPSMFAQLVNQWEDTSNT